MTNELTTTTDEDNNVTELLPAKNKGGRPSKVTEWLTDDALLQVTAWARDGLFMEQIAKNMGISIATFNEWRNKFPAFSVAVKDGRAVVDQVIENAMFKRATGYQYEEDVYEADENGELVVVKRIVKTEAPNTAAQIFWMKNRRPEEWRDKVEIQNEHSGSIKVELGEMSKWSD